jgi:hypothetical protein
VTSVGSEPKHGEGDAIVLEGLCNASSLGSASGVSLPAGSAFTLEGKPGTSSGIEGAGIEGSLLSGTGLGPITIAGLVFADDDVSAADSPVNLRAERVTLTDDSFLGNSHEGVTGGALTVYVGPPKACPGAGGPPAISVSGSTFRDNTDTIAGGIGGGGAAFLLDNCDGAQNAIDGNVFEGNALRANGERAVGGALLVASESEPGAGAASQAGNVFAQNSVVDVSGVGDYGGGGEWLEGLSLTSVGDRFSANTIAGTSGPNWSWGAGLGLLACRNTEPAVSTLENAVVQGNAIGAGEAADLGGAGLYVGCPASGTPNHLSLLDSTVTENSAPAGGVAGIDGGPHDQLQLANSIVAADTGGSETGGFAGEGGAISARFSDVCNAAGTSPFAGEGNICANPLLADNGNAASADVHETPGSPTIDRGSNALVPSGLTTDFYGAPRVQASRFVPIAVPAGVCLPGDDFIPAAPIVDMGASEYSQAGAVPVPPCGFNKPRRNGSPSVFALPVFHQRPRGLLALSFSGLDAGRLRVLATCTTTRTILERVKGKLRHVRKPETIVYGRASYVLASARNLTIELTPTKQALALLRRRRHLRVLLSITFTATGDSPTTHTKTIIATYLKPRPRHHH